MEEHASAPVYVLNYMTHWPLGSVIRLERKLVCVLVLDGKLILLLKTYEQPKFYCSTLNVSPVFISCGCRRGREARRKVFFGDIADLYLTRNAAHVIVECSVDNHAQYFCNLVIKLTIVFQRSV